MEVNMDVSIIIVNWNSTAYVRKCLRSICCNSQRLGLEVIVVDNGSFDGCRDLVTREFPQVIFLQSQYNLGFAGANNLGAARAGGKILLFLNPDTEVIGDALSQMAAVFGHKPRAGAVGCKLLNTDGTLQTSCIQPFPTILNQALNAEVMLRVTSRIGVRSIRPLFYAAKGISPVEAVSGACLMVCKDAFHAVGGFSPDYFMYTEDIDLCYKMRQAGFINYYINSAVVVHHGRGSSAPGKEFFYADIQMSESVLKFLRTTRGGPYASCYRLTMFVAALLRIGLIAVLLIPSLFFCRFQALKHSFVKWCRILRWTLRENL